MSRDRGRLEHRRRPAAASPFSAHVERGRIVRGGLPCVNEARLPPAEWGTDSKRDCQQHRRETRWQLVRQLAATVARIVGACSFVALCFTWERGSGAREKSCFRESFCRQQLIHMHLRGIVFQVGMAAVPQREMECSGKSLRVSSTRTRRSFSLSLRLSMRQ